MNSTNSTWIADSLQLMTSSTSNSFKFVYYFDVLQKFFLISQFVVIFLSIISDTFIVKFMINVLQSKLDYPKKRPIVLMTSIAFAGLMLNLNATWSLLIVNSWLRNSLSLISTAQSIMYYINALSLFSISISMTLFACYQYFQFVRVFTNPMDNISNKKLFLIAWFPSLLLAIPSFFFNNVYYYDFKDFSFTCYHFDNYLKPFNRSKLFRSINFLFMITFQCIIPALAIFTFFTAVIVELLKKQFTKINSLGSPVIIKFVVFFILFIMANSIIDAVYIRELFLIITNNEDKFKEDTCPVLELSSPEL